MYHEQGAILEDNEKKKNQFHLNLHFLRTFSLIFDQVWGKKYAAFTYLV